MTSFARSGANAVLVLAVLSNLTGCGSGTKYEGAERAAVTGTVTLDGNPLPFGNIMFVAGGGAAAQRTASGIILNGNYSIDEANGPNFGEYRVMISGHSEIPADAIASLVKSEPVLSKSMTLSAVFLEVLICSSFAPDGIAIRI